MRQQLQEKRADQALLRQLQTANKGLDAELKSVKAELRAVAEEQKAATALAEEQKVRSCSHAQLDSVFILMTSLHMPRMTLALQPCLHSSLLSSGKNVAFPAAVSHVEYG